MGFVEIIIVSLGLAMDAMAVAVCKGLAMKKINYRKMIVIGLYFGFFQAIMPIIGYILGSTFSSFIKDIDHWVAFFLLLIIGLNMIKESKDDELEKRNDDTSFKTMILLSIATSIDALAVGITISLFNSSLFISAITIGIITFVLSIIGVLLGNKFGDKFQNKSEFAGGVILIIIGFKILLEHLGLLI